MAGIESLTTAVAIIPFNNSIIVHQNVLEEGEILEDESYFIKELISDKTTQINQMRGLFQRQKHLYNGMKRYETRYNDNLAAVEGVAQSSADLQHNMEVIASMEQLRLMAILETQSKELQHRVNATRRAKDKADSLLTPTAHEQNIKAGGEMKELMQILRTKNKEIKALKKQFEALKIQNDTDGQDEEPSPSKPQQDGAPTQKEGPTEKKRPRLENFF